MASSRSLIDIDRTRTRSASRHRHTTSSPYGSPTNDSSPILRSALKHTNTVSPSLDDAGQSGFNLDNAPEEEQRGRGGGPETGPKSTAVPSIYTRRVGFNTFEAGVDLEGVPAATGGGTGVNFSFTTSAKSAHFSRTKQSRTFLVGTDLNEYSKHALEFVLHQLAEDHDEIVVLRVISDPAAQTRPGELETAKDEAEELLESIMKSNGDELQISIIVEFAVGPIEETIHRMIEVYTPDSLIVGTRGLPDSVFRTVMGSISRYCVARSPVPVVVVRPEDKVRESLSRRQHDPKRRSYLSLVGMGGSGDNLALERTKTAPQGGDRAEPAMTKEEKKAAKEDRKGKEFKKFGTFS